jgi:3-hydroxyisobutyrate dehydrogenase-like beta-hydroxyacid dehydrogenase
MKLAFAGMGIMGSAMAANLLKAGHEVTVWNRSAEKCRPLQEAGAKVARSLPETADGAEIVFLCVSDTPDVEAVLFGEGGLAEGLSRGQIVVDMSTISPGATEEFAGMLEADGIEMLDAPVSGGQSGAVEGTLTIMCGGKRGVFDRVKPAFEAMGRNIVYCGGHGNGQRVKAVNQVICALNILATSEGLLFAQRSGLDLETVHSVVSSGAAGSWMLSSLGPKMIAGDWAPGFMIRLQAKDLRIASEEMQALGGGFAGTELTTRLFGAATTEGLGDEGTQALVKLLGWES